MIKNILQVLTVWLATIACILCLIASFFSNQRSFVYFKRHKGTSPSAETVINNHDKIFSYFVVTVHNCSAFLEFYVTHEMSN